MYCRKSSIEQCHWCSGLPNTLLPAVFLGIFLLVLPVLIYAQYEQDKRQTKQEDFFFLEGKEVAVTITFDKIGLWAKEEVADSVIREFIHSLNLQIILERRGGLFILGLKGPLSRKELREFITDVTKQGEQVLRKVGMVVNVTGSKHPNILTEEFIVQFRDDILGEQIGEFNKEHAVQVIMANPFVNNQFLLRVSEASQMDALAMSRLYYQSDLAVSAYPNFIGVFHDQQPVIPNDPLFGNQWHLDNTGQGGGTVDADADLPLAWDITMGNQGTIIAVLENGGFDMNHPDLTPNFWVNPGEDLNSNGIIEPTEINGVDDDANTYADDFYGWDFVGGDNNPAPATTEHHGTAVAGVAGVRGDNALGVSGSCPNCALIFLRTGYVSSDFDKSLAFGYAQQMGARIITNSWGNGGFMPNTAAAITNATTAGVVVLFAAGNSNINNCTDPLVSRADVIAVSSSTNLDRKANDCSFGNCIDILAPSFHGDVGTIGITTTDRLGTVGYDITDYTNSFGGTSSATPLIAGVVGLMLSVNPNLTREQIQRLLQDTADKIEPGVAAYADNTGFSSPASGIATHSWGRLNAFEAVRIAAPIPVGGKEGVDIFFRDNHLDWGNTEQPSNTLFESPRSTIGHWQSMDIKVDAPPYQITPTAATFDAFTDENPSVASGDMNRVYVRVRNRGPVTASSVTVKLLWTQFGTALPPLPRDFWAVWPSNSANTTQWHPLNCSGSRSSICAITKLVYSGSSVAGTAADAAQIVQFDFPAPTPDPTLSDHFCLLAMIDSWQDTILPKSRPATIPSDFVVDILTPTDNNITHRNYSNLTTGRATSFEQLFFVRNPTVHRIDMILDLNAPDGWNISLDTLAFNRPIILEPNQEILVTMKATLPEINLSGEVTITQMRTDVQPPEVMGGVTYGFSGVPLPPSRFSLSIHGGTAIPTGSFADDFEFSYNGIVDIDYHFTPRLALVGLLGYNHFRSKIEDIDDTYWINLSLNLRYYWPIRLMQGPLFIYIGAGPGIYIPKDDDIEFGANVGFGVVYPFRPNIHFEIGADYHWIFNPDLQFTHSHAGLVFRF